MPVIGALVGATVALALLGVAYSTLERLWPAGVLAQLAYPLARARRAI